MVWLTKCQIPLLLCLLACAVCFGGAPGSRYNESCNNTPWCEAKDPSSECSTTEDVCVCKNGYLLNDVTSLCTLVTENGEESRHDQPCTGTPWCEAKDPSSECHTTDLVCVCKDDYILNDVSSVCTLDSESAPGSRYNHSCENTLWCEAKDPSSECSRTDLVCVCKDDYILNDVSSLCTLDSENSGTLWYDDDESCSGTPSCEANDPSSECSTTEHVCVCKNGYLLNDVTSLCTLVTETGEESRHDQPCTDTPWCEAKDPSSECSTTEDVCVCKYGYVHNEYTGLCTLDTETGEESRHDQPCTDTPWCEAKDPSSECSTTEDVCVCKYGYVHNEYTGLCTLDTETGEESRHDQPCTDTPWCEAKDPSSECSTTEDVCVCKYGYVHNEYTGLCTLDTENNSRYDVECTENSWCRETDNNAFCDTVIGVCKCKENYLSTGDNSCLYMNADGQWFSQVGRKCSNAGSDFDCSLFDDNMECPELSDVQPTCACKNPYTLTENQKCQCEFNGMSIEGTTASKEDMINYAEGTDATFDGVLMYPCQQLMELRFGWNILEEGMALVQMTVDVSSQNLVIPGLALAKGQYEAIFEVILPDVLGETDVSKKTRGWFRIQEATALVATIAGGSAHSHGCDNELIVDASESHDPAADTSPLQFTWFCSLTSEMDMLPTSKPTIDSYQRRGCFGNGLKLEETSSVLTIESSQLICGDDMIIRVFVSKEDDRHSFYDQTVTTVSGSPPDVHIECIDNCMDKVIPTKRLVLKALCEECKQQHHLTYQWHSVSGDVDLTEISSSATDQCYLVVPKDSLSYDVLYSFKVQVTEFVGSVGFSGFSVYTFSSAAALSDGYCVITPDAGFVLQTLFTVSCQDFSPPGEQLQYSVYAHKDATRSLVSRSFEEVIEDLLFPSGEESNDYMLQVSVVISNAYQLSTTVDLTLKVEEIAIDVATLESMTTGGSSMLEELIIAENFQGATQLLSSVSSVLNEQALNDSTKEDKEIRIQMRENLVNVISSIEVTSIEVLQQSASALNTLTQEGSELSSNVHVNGAELLLTMCSFLTDVTEKNATTEEIEETGKMLAYGVSNIMVSMEQSDKSDEEDDSMHAQDNAEQKHKHVRNVTLNTIRALANVKSALLRNKVPGDIPTVLSTDALTVKLQRRDSQNLNGTDVGITENKRAAQFSLPTSFWQGDDLSGDVGVETTHYKFNLYTWSNSSKDVTTTLNELELKSDTGTSITVNNLTTPVSIMIPQNQQFEMFNVSLSNISSAFVEFASSSEDATMLLIITAEDNTLVRNTKLSIYEGMSFNDSLTRNLTNEVPVYLANLEDSSGLERSLVVKLHIPGSHLLLLEHEEERNMSVLLSQISCLYWDVDNEKWHGDGCEVGNQTSRSQIECKCSHLTSFAGGFLVMPNTLNLKEDLAMFLTFWENPVGIAVVAVVMGCYILIVLLARRKDLKDEIKAAVVDLADNDMRDNYNYIISLETGSRRNSGTTANVVMVLVGSNDESVPHVVFSSSCTMCQRGRKDVFIIRTRRPLGEITAITLWHDNTGTSPQWFVSACQVVDAQTGKISDFVCNSWLAEGLGESVLCKTFNGATDEEKQNLEFLFFTNASVGMKNNHLWFSTITHRCDSHFTTVQRVSCCLCLFMTYMLANIMFYGIEPEAGGEQKMDIGPTTITWTELRIGFQSAILMLPINLLIVAIFQYSRRRYPRQLYQVYLDTLKVRIDDKELLLVPEKESTDLLKLPQENVSQSGASLRQYFSFQDVDKEDKQLEADGKSPFLETPLKPKKLLLPWWCAIIAWILIIAVSFTCSFFTILYTFNYGLETSLKWVGSLFLAFISDALLAQPVKVVALALILSLIFKTSLKDEADCSINLSQGIIDPADGNTESLEELRTKLPCYVPPDDKGSAHRAHVVPADDKRVYQLFYEILRYLTFLYLVLLIAYGQKDKRVYRLNAYISKLLFEDAAAVSDFQGLFEWMEDTAVPAMYDTSEQQFITGIPSLRLASPYLVQTRYKYIHCLQYLRPASYDLFHIPATWGCGLTQRDTANCSEGWKHEDDAQQAPGPWTYSSVHNGYVVELGDNLTAALSTLSYLKQSLWLDAQSVTLHMYLMTYTANLNLLTSVEASFNFKRPPGVHMEKSVSTTKMYRSTHSFHIFVLVLEVLYVVYALYFTVYVIRTIVRMKRKYFRNVWSFLDLSTVLTSWTVIAVYICHIFAVEDAVSAYHTEQRISGFSKVMLLDTVMGYFLALLVVSAMLKFLHMLRFNPIIHRFLATLHRARHGILCMTAIIFVIFLAFGSLMFPIASHKLEMFRSVPATFTSLYLGMIGDYDMSSLAEIHPYLGPLAMLAFLVVASFVALNMFISILMTTLSQVKKENMPNEEARLLALLLDKGLQWLGISHRTHK